jgi:hypothetical protein
MAGKIPRIDDINNAVVIESNTDEANLKYFDFITPQRKVDYVWASRKNMSDRAIKYADRYVKREFHGEETYCIGIRLPTNTGKLAILSDISVMGEIKNHGHVHYTRVQAIGNEVYQCNHHYGCPGVAPVTAIESLTAFKDSCYVKGSRRCSRG